MHAPARRSAIQSRRLFYAALPVIVLLGATSLVAQAVPSVQQYQFRSQWVGEQVDQIPLGSRFPPLGGLGSLVGSLQTPDQVQREVEASEAGLNAPSPFTFHPSLGVGWQISNQGNQSGENTTASGNQSSGFAAPSLSLGYSRDHGPWTVSAQYSAGYRYYLNSNYTGAGTGSAQNPFSQTALCSAILEMSRYHVDALVTASSGAGYDTTSASYNLQTAVSGTLGAKYVLSSSTSLDAHAGYTIQNASGSTATPNNNTASSFADLSEIYNLTEKTHLSLIVSAGSSSQGLQQGTSVTGNTPLTNSQNAARTYGQGLVSVNYHFSQKLVFDVGLGARYVSSTVTSSLYTGLSPAYTLGISYTPTEKTSVVFSSGLQAADVTPEVNLSLLWKPREKTQFSIGFSQNEQFANSLSGQYVISRGISGSVTQKLFNGVSLSLTGGYTTQDYINLSSETMPGQSSSQLPSSYYFGSLSVFWNICDWASLVNNLTFNTGQQQGGSGGTTQPQYLYSISLNFSL